MLNKEILTYEQYLLIKSITIAGVRAGVDLVKDKYCREVDAIDDECEARNISVVEVLKDWSKGEIK